MVKEQKSKMQAENDEEETMTINPIRSPKYNN